MGNRWIWIFKRGTMGIFFTASFLLGLVIGRGSVKAHEMQIGQPSTPWSATLRLAWDFLTCFYLFVPLLLLGFACLRYLSSHLSDSAKMRRSDAFYTLGALVLMLLGLFSVGLRPPSVQW